MRPFSRRFGRRLRRAAVVSLLIHLIVLSVGLHYYRSLDLAKEQRSSETERVTIEHVSKVAVRSSTSHRAAPATKVATAPIPQPIPVPVQRPVPVVVHKLALVTPPVEPRTLPVPKVLKKYVEPKVEQPAAVVPKVVASVPKTPAVAEGPKHFSDQQIADIENNLGDAIAHDRERNNPLNGTATAPVAAMKHYGMDGDAFAITHGGLCDPIKSWTDDGWNYYYYMCNAHGSDGSFDREAIPWPVRFRPDQDPNIGNGPARTFPIPMPLPGWHLPPGEPVADGVREYAAEHGVNL